MKCRQYSETSSVFAFLEIPEGIIYALTPFCAIILVEAHIGQYGGCATSSVTFFIHFTRKVVSVAQSALDQTFLNIDDVSDVSDVFDVSGSFPPANASHS